MRVVDGEKEIYIFTGQRVESEHPSKKLSKRPLVIYNKVYKTWYTFDTLEGFLIWDNIWGPTSSRRPYTPSWNYMIFVGHQKYPYPEGKSLKDEVILMLHIEAGFNNNQKCQKVLDEWKKADYNVD